jgi:two-component system NtrC family sensor kinase
MHADPHQIEGAGETEMSAVSLSPDCVHSRITELEERIAVLTRREAAANLRIADLESQLAAGRVYAEQSSYSRLDTLLAISANLLVTHEIGSLLNLVVREATTLFQNHSRALLFLTRNKQHITVRSYKDQHEDIELTLLHDHPITSHAFLAPRAMLMDTSELRMIVRQIKLDTMFELPELNGPNRPRSVLLAPLHTDSERIGALVLCCDANSPGYHPNDLPFIQALADLAAVAIDDISQRERSASLETDLARERQMHRQAQSQLDTAQAQLLQSAKLAAIGELAASVAHEINNPLYAARNSLYLLEQDLPADLPQRRFLEIAQGELGRISRIITRMRDFYRPQRSELAETSVNSLLHDTVDFVRTYLRHGQINVTTSFDPTLPLLIAHADQLRQVFLNIVLNACDAMASGGTLHVATETVGANNGGHLGVMIRISDTGTGIEPAHLEHLFEPFYTTKPQGTGLGLAITAHIVTQHAGEISVESEVGKGTTFTITLPVVSELAHTPE